MELLTKSDYSEIRRTSDLFAGRQRSEGRGACKVFQPHGSRTWLITEAEKQEDGDWKLFGFCHICEWEWGYLMLSDLQRIVLPGGLGIERDLYTQGRIVEDFIE